MAPYQIYQHVAKITRMPQPLKQSLKIIQARLKDGFKDLQIMGYMEWVSHQPWLKNPPTLKLCTRERLAKWVNEGEPLPHGSILMGFKYDESKERSPAFGKEFRLHASDLEMYLRCPKQLWFKMVKGPVPPPAAAFRGTCFHKVLHANFSQKIETKEDIPLGDAKDVFDTAWEGGWKEAEFQEGEEPSRMKDEGYSMVGVYWGKTARVIQPLFSEKGFEADLDIIPVAGTIDRVTEGKLIDDKTAAKAWRNPGGRLQSFFYTLAWLKETDSLLPFSFIITTPSASEEVPAMVFPSELLWFLTDLLPKAYNDIQAGRFTPNPCHPWACTQHWCGWWRWCRGKEEPNAVAMLRRIL